MRKIEIFTFGFILLLYINKIFQFIELPDFWVFNFIASLIIAITGFKIYRSIEYSNKTKAVLFAMACGFAFSFAIIAPVAKIMNYENSIALYFSIPNFILFIFLLIQVVWKRDNSKALQHKYYRGLFIRSSVFMVMVIIIVLLPFRFINLHLNKEEPQLYNRGLGHLYYDISLKYSENKEYENALEYAHKSLNSFIIGFEDTLRHYKSYQAFYEAYKGLINEGYQKRDYNKALKYGILIQKPIKLFYGENSYESAYINSRLAQIYYKLGNDSRCDSLYNNALNKLEKYYGYKNMLYANIQANQADFYANKYDYSYAIDLYESSIKIYLNDSSTIKDLHDFKSKEMVTQSLVSEIYTKIALLYSQNEHYDSADIFFEKAFSNKYYIESNSYSNGLTRLYKYYLGLRKYNDAKKAIETAITYLKETTGEENLYYLFALDRLSAVNQVIANYDEAEKGYQQAIQLAKKINHSDIRYNGKLHYKLGEIKYLKASYDSAFLYYGDALDYFSTNTKGQAIVLNALSILNSKLYNYSEALAQSEQAIGILKEEGVDEDSPYMISYFSNQAHIFYLLGNTTKATELYNKCYSIDTSYSNNEALSFASILNGLALIKQSQNRFAEADSLFYQSLEIYKKSLGEMHPSYALVLHNLAYSKMSENKLGEAEILFNESLNINKIVFDDDHDEIANSYVGLGELKMKMKQYKEALSLFKKALSIYQAKFNNEHIKIKMTNENIKKASKKIAFTNNR